MFITQCDLFHLTKWFKGSGYEVMAIYLSGGTSDDKLILSNLIDNWREIDNMSRNLVCYIYFDSEDERTKDASIMNFVSWVREYNSFTYRDYRKDADAALKISREICNHYGIFEYELPGLLFIDKQTDAYQLIPITHFNEIKQYLRIINIVCSYSQDVSLAHKGIESVKLRKEMKEEELSLQIKKIEIEIQQLSNQRCKTEKNLSQLCCTDSKVLEKDYYNLRSQLLSYYETAKTFELPTDSFSIQKIKKYIKNHNIELPVEFFDALFATHKCISQLTAKYHIDREVVLDVIKNDLPSWTSIISTEIHKTINRMSSKKFLLDEEIKNKNCVFNSLLETKQQLCVQNQYEIESAKVKAKYQLSEMTTVYSKRLNDVIHVGNEVCEELLRGLKAHNLFCFIREMVEKQVNFEENQDVKYKLIKTAIKNNQYDVFISCKSEDYIYANDIYDFLVSIGKHPFLADKSIDDIHYDEYNVLIRETIDTCPDMIVFLSDPSFANTPYVSYEWNLFVNEKAAGRKEGNLIPIIGDLSDIPSLPIALRQCQACTMTNYKDILPKYLH